METGNRWTLISRVFWGLGMDRGSSGDPPRSGGIGCSASLAVGHSLYKGFPKMEVPFVSFRENFSEICSRDLWERP